MIGASSNGIPAGTTVAGRSAGAGSLEGAFPGLTGQSAQFLAGGMRQS